MHRVGPRRHSHWSAVKVKFERAVDAMAEVRRPGGDYSSAEAETTETRALEPDAIACDACGAAMKPMGHCKYWCLRCGFMRTCNDVI